MSNYTITFACYNSLDYTKKCVESLLRANISLDRVVVVDNDSSDATFEYLSSFPFFDVIRNRDNLGCGVAWNQGVLRLQSDWSIVMNNDIEVSKGWLDALLGDADRRSLSVICPAMIEGDLNYDFDQFAISATKKMGDVFRFGARHAVCMAIHKSVWQRVGYFAPVPSLMGYEDTLFFSELDRAGIDTGITGAAWIHHYGSITVSNLKKERGLSGDGSLGDRKNHKLLNKSLFRRKWDKLSRKRQERRWRNDELAAHQMTLHGTRSGKDFSWI